VRKHLTWVLHLGLLIRPPPDGEEETGQKKSRKTGTSHQKTGSVASGRIAAPEAHFARGEAIVVIRSSGKAEDRERGRGKVP